MKAGIIAALPGELKPLVRGWRAGEAKDGVRKWTRNAGTDLWVAVCAGMGADAARRAFAAAEEEGPLDLVLSVGWAGALVPELHAGDARVFSVVIDAQTGEQFQLAAGEAGLTLVTTARVADATEKVRLRATYSGTVMVDMEAATVARMAQMRASPSQASRAFRMAYLPICPTSIDFFPRVVKCAWRPFWRTLFCDRGIGGPLCSLGEIRRWLRGE